jgi:predicted transcriptional regulator
VIHIRKTSESFAGVHQAIVDQRTFEIVQRVLEGKTVVRTHRHEFAYSRMIRCALCGQTAMAEVQKSHTYYRCHTKDCATKTIRQERLEEAISQAFVPLRFSHDEIAYARRWFKWKRDHRQEDSRRQIEACNLQLAQIRDRMVRLTDAYIDGAIDKTLLDERRSALLMDEAALKQRIVDLESGSDATSAKLEKFLELVQTAQTLHKLTQPAEKRTLVKSLTSNLLIDRKNAAITLNSAAQLLANRPKSSCCALRRGVPRTFDKLLIQLEKMFTPPKERTLALAA